MAVKTLDSLKRQNNREIEKSEQGMGIVQIRLEDCSAHHEETIRQQLAELRKEHQELLQEQDRIDNFRKKMHDEQREVYGGTVGTEKWHSEFQCVKTIPERRGQSAEERQRSILDMFSVLPECKEKRFQQVFCDPDDYTLPHFEDENSNRFVTHPNNVPIDAVMINPDRIPDKLLDDLHGGQFWDGYLYELNEWDPIDKAAEKDSQAHMLREVWMGAGYLSPENGKKNNERMLVVEEGAPPSADVDGSILVTRNTSEGNGEKCVQFFGSAYSCRRSAFHEDQTRLEELALLTRLESDIQRLHSAVGLITKETPVNKKGDTIEKANNTLLECERALHACQNKYKKTIRNIADEMPDLTIIRKHDKRRIFNPSGCMAKMLKALRMIKERLGEMRPLNHFNADDHHDLSVQIKRDEEAMSKFVNTVLSKSNGVEACVNDNALSHDTVNIISDSLQTESLQQVRLRPNRTFAQAILDEMRKAIHYCRNDDNPNKPQIRRHLATVNIIGKLWGVSHVFENFRDQIVSNGDINGENGDYFQSIADAKTLIVRLRKVFDERQLFSEVTVIKWVGPCEAMMQGFADIERGLEIYMKRDFDENGHEVERLAMFQRLTEFMDQFDIEKIVQGGWMDESGEDE